MIRKSAKLLLQFMGLKVNRVPRHLRFSRGIRGDEIVLPEKFNSDVIIDVGVAGGTPWLYQQFPTQKLILIDPLFRNDSLYDLLNGREYIQHECALGNIDSNIEINYDLDRPSLSSLHERTELTKREDHRIEKQVVPIKKLDQVIGESEPDSAKFGLKIDTEGHELEVLKGATETLKKCEFVVCEASIEKRFNDSYNFSDLIVFMDSRGFEITRVLRFGEDDAGVIRLADVLFEKKSES
ncbi:FkbM family methyltransferase [Roseibium sp.]|uniref:FkbM family methyltransferase n=1 Tax=Roseibium sp. TaxID=1936156 RepID=UPI003BAD49CA